LTDWSVIRLSVNCDTQLSVIYQKAQVDILMAHAINTQNNKSDKLITY